MSAHVLLNLFSRLENKGKMLGLPSILLLFCKVFYKFNISRSINVRFF